ncbi:MAG TPA: carboxypeptidase-like regulatory domain-containing protein [Ktedonobacterales bacterium]|nr:carboxypeptidase-like regulatory domain-containing protein [Ktedonobacterales bacterium]
MRGRTFAAALRLSLLAALALTLAWALVALATPSARAADGAGTVAGVVTNGTHNAAVAGQKVTLQLALGSTVKDLATTTTDARGAFTFDGVDAGPTSLGGRWAVYTTYEGGLYSSAPVTVKAGQTVDAPLAVYDATQDSSNLRVTIATILIRQPDATHGLVGVGEFFTIENTGKTAFVGQAPSGAGATTMPSLLRFALPANAVNLSTGVGFFNTQVIQVDSGFATTATVPPGQTEFAFAFQAPYTGTTLSIPFKAEYPTAQVVALVPPNMLVRDTSGLTAQGIVTSFGARYQVFSATNAAHDSRAVVNLYDLPQAGERQDLNTTALLWLAAALAALLALFAGLYIWRGALGAALGLVPTPATTLPGRAMRHELVVVSEAERKRLLVAMLDLERRHARGDLSDERFKQEDATLRQRLRELLAGAGQQAASASATAETDGALGIATDAEMAEPAPGSRGGAR